MTWAALPLAALITAASPTQTVTLNAERLLHDSARKLTTAEGAAELTASNAAMNGDRITWDENAQGATAVGHVTLRLVKGGLIGIVADVVSVRVEGDEVAEVFVYDGLALRKKGLSPEQLLAAKTQDEVRTVGGTSMTMSTSHLMRQDDGTWRIDELTFTPCDCDLERPAWRIVASQTTLDFERERASLFNPVFRVFDVPLLWLPWVSLPLSDRQTGLLVPQPTISALNGFGLSQPVFVTLGRSADVTFSPGYYFGGDRKSDNGIRGPRLLTEFRYTPSIDVSGRATLGLLYDLNDQRNPIDRHLRWDEPRGVRVDATWQHTHNFGRGFGARVDAQVLSDGYLQQDLVTDVLARENGLLRSTAVAFQRGADHYVGLDVAFRQDVSTGYPIFGTATTLRANDPKYGPNPLQRLPALTVAIPEQRIAGPLSASLFAEYARIAPTWGGTGDEGVLANEGRAVVGDTAVTPECLQARVAYVTPSSPACADRPDQALRLGLGDRQYQPGEREGRDRLDLMPTLAVQGSLFDVVSARAFAAWRQDVWVGELSRRVGQRGYALLGARLDSELARTFGGTVRHTIAPALEVRAVPVAVGEQPAPFDATDAAIPTLGPHVQARALLRQRLLMKEGGAIRELLTLELGQGIDALHGRLSESYGQLSLSVWRARAAAAVRVDPLLARLTRLSAGAAVDIAAGSRVYANYERLIDEGTDRARAPLDLFFAGAPVSSVQGHPQNLTAGASWRFGGWGVRYDAMFQEFGFKPDPLQEQLTYALTFVQHTLGVSYGPACDCFRVEVTATQRLKSLPGAPFAEYRPFPDLSASVSITGFGKIGTGQ